MEHLALICLICGGGFSAPKKPRGRHRGFCSAACKAVGAAAHRKAFRARQRANCATVRLVPCPGCGSPIDGRGRRGPMPAQCAACTLAAERVAAHARYASRELRREKFEPGLTPRHVGVNYSDAESRTPPAARGGSPSWDKAPSAPAARGVQGKGSTGAMPDRFVLAARVR